MADNGVLFEQQRLAMSTKEMKDSMGIHLERPKFPHYALLDKRLDSFKTWPSSNPLSPETLAEAGLVYTGKGDSVRCYHCGGGLRNWEDGDSVWVEHAKWFPSCPHVNLVKGAKYVRGVRDKKIFTDDGVVEEEEVKVPVTDKYEVLLSSIAAESCLLMGLDKERVKQAIRVYIDRNGDSDFRAQDLAEIVFDMEENGGVWPTQPEEKHSGKVEVCPTVDKSGTSYAGPQKMTCNVEPENMETETIEPEMTDELVRENARLKELKQCKICLDASSSVIFLPCGHMVSCPQCAPALIKCPICRTVIKGTVKAYFA